MKTININVKAHELKKDCKYIIVLKSSEVSTESAYDVVRYLADMGVESIAVLCETDNGLRVELVPKD